MQETRVPSRTTLVTALPWAAVALWVLAGLVAALDWSGTVSGRSLALFGLAGATTVATVVANARRAEQRIVSAVEQAPRQEYYRGYGDGAGDALDAGS